jgi:hypothetical protein
LHVKPRLESGDPSMGEVGGRVGDVQTDPAACSASLMVELPMWRAMSILMYGDHQVVDRW